MIQFLVSERGPFRPLPTFGRIRVRSFA